MINSHITSQIKKETTNRHTVGVHSRESHSDKYKINMRAKSNNYSTAQLQGNVRTHLKRVQDASGTHARRVHASAKPRDKAGCSKT